MRWIQRAVFVLALLGIVPVLHAQSRVETADKIATGTLGSLNATVTVQLQGRNSIGVHLDTSNLIATANVEVSYDGGVSWGTDTRRLLWKLSTGGFIQSTTGIVIASADVDFVAISTPGASHARVILTAYTSGTSTTTIRASTYSGNYSVTVDADIPTVTVGQVSCTTSATQIVAARSGRRGLAVTQLGTVDVYLGASGVTTSTGQLLLGTKGSTFSAVSSGAFYCIVASGTQSVTFMEVY